MRINDLFGTPDDVWMKLHLSQPSRIHGLFVARVYGFTPLVVEDVYVYPGTHTGMSGWYLVNGL